MVDDFFSYFFKIFLHGTETDGTEIKDERKWNTAAV
jgi:hypothetical protein